MKRTPKYIVWHHLSESSSTGTQPMPLAEARRVKDADERRIMTPRGTLPAWPKIEIRQHGNPPSHIAQAAA